MIRYLFVSLLAILLIALSIFGMFRAYEAGRRSASDQIYLDMATTGLIGAQCETATPQLKEYAKAQLYYYSAQLHPPKLFVDLGPVQESMLKDLEPFIRHADSPNDYYRKLKAAQQGAAANP
jgi:hypothetical protein